MKNSFNALLYLFNILYAVDTSILLPGNDIQKLVSEFNRELEHISEWLKANTLTLNTNKTHSMVFHKASYI